MNARGITFTFSISATYSLSHYILAEQDTYQNIYI